MSALSVAVEGVVSQVGGSRWGRLRAMAGSAVLRSKLRPLTDPDRLVVRSPLHQVLEHGGRGRPTPPPPPPPGRLVASPPPHKGRHGAASSPPPLGGPPAGSGKTSLLATWY